jgi:hypothetical protein
MNPVKELEDLREELEEKTEKLKKEVRQKLDDEEIQRIAEGPGLRKFPGNTREQHMLYFYTLRKQDIEKTLSKLNRLETAELEEKIENLKEEAGRNLTEKPEKADRQSKASRSLQRAVNAIKGEDYGDFNEVKYETSDLYNEQQENKVHREKRLEAVETFLSAPGLLGEKLPYRKQLADLKGIEKEDLEEADRYTEKIEETRQELRERAEMINQSLKRASYNLGKLEQ